MMKILITGTHFTPAVAVCEELKKKNNISLVYVGRTTTFEGDDSQSVESHVLPKLGVKFISITTGRLQRVLTLYTIISLFKIPFGFLKSVYIILSEKPDVILSFGGYVSIPVVFAGWLFSIPIIIHEQTLDMGLANKICSFFADKIAVSFKNNLDWKNSKIILTGNPIRKSILQSGQNQPKKMHPPTILVTGGNQGSHTINLAVEKVLSKLTKFARIIHVTGENKFLDYERLKEKENENYLVKKWIDEDWAKYLLQTDLVISRAGINTLSELAFLGKPALVIPIPYLYQDEQNKNGKFFEKLGLVKVLPQARLSPETLIKNVKDMLSNLENWRKSAKGAKEIIIPDAAKRLALETQLLYKKNV